MKTKETVSPEVQNMRDLSDDFGVVEYVKPLTPEQIAEAEHAHTAKNIEIAALEAELKALKDEYKAKIEPLKLEAAQRMYEVRIKGRPAIEELYVNFDKDAGIATYVNIHGEPVMEVINGQVRPMQRRMLPDEYQQKMKFISGSGTAADPLKVKVS